MGCNCSKNGSPTGFAQQKPEPWQLSDTAHEASRIGPEPTGQGQPEPVGATQSFTLRTGDGRTQSFGSKLEADAARIRAGGGQIQPA